VFGVAVVVAGFVYLALQRVTWSTPEPPEDPEERQRERQAADQQAQKPKPAFVGSVSAFVVACVITVWAVLGELWLTLRLIRELGGATGFNLTAEIVMYVLMAASAVLVALYVWRRLLYALADAPEDDSVQLSRGIIAGLTVKAERQSVSLL
jgi:hypothetical protein